MRGNAEMAEISICRSADTAARQAGFFATGWVPVACGITGSALSDTWSLAEARERARECRQLRAQGHDPIEERRAEREKAQLEAASAMTFRQCAEACHKNPAFLPAPMPRL